MRVVVTFTVIATLAGVGVVAGFTVGFAEGVALGFADGVALGFTDGVAVGLVEGAVVGFTVGMADAATVGFTVGVADGAAVGFVVGVADGATVGFDDGLRVGVVIVLGRGDGVIKGNAETDGDEFAIALGIAEGAVVLGVSGEPVPEPEPLQFASTRVMPMQNKSDVSFFKGG